MTYTAPEPKQLTQAETAAAMRRALRAAFPGRRISVRIVNASMYTGVRVNWDVEVFRRIRAGWFEYDLGATLDVVTAGPTPEAVEAVVEVFRSSWFGTDERGGDSRAMHGDASVLVSEDAAALPVEIRYAAGHVEVSPSYVFTYGPALTDAEWAAA
jgi:hypothetical protein